MQRRRLFQHALRVATLLAGAGLLPARAASGPFQARTLPELARLLGGSAPADSREVTLAAPDIAETGATVPFTIGCSAAGVRRLALFVEKNPVALSAVFDVGELADPAFTLNVKMGESSPVVAVALLADGRALYTRREVKVTLGGCAA